MIDISVVTNDLDETFIDLHLTDLMPDHKVAVDRFGTTKLGNHCQSPTPEICGNADALAQAMQAMAARYSQYDSFAIRKRALATYGEAAFLGRMAHVCRHALQ
jgi:hypothetical protein